MSFFRKLFARDQPPVITPQADALKRERGKPLVHASYPPRHDGIPLASKEELIEVQEDLIRRLKLHAAALKTDFYERFEIPITNLATYISNIPGSKDAIYGGPGGLFRACLECAFYSYQSSDGKIFTGQLGVEDRHLLEKRWRYICFLSGLLFPIGQTLEKIRVTNDSGEGWLIRADSLTQWAENSQSEHYYVGWPREDVAPGPSVLGGALSIQIAGTAAIRYLEEGSSALTTAYSEIASNLRTDFNSIAFDLVASMWERLKKAELARLPQNYGRVQFGQHNAPIIVDAMRECIAEGKWIVNEKSVLADSTGVYLIWPRAGHDLLASAKITALKGMPSSSSGLLQVMLDEKMLFTDAQQSAYVDVADADGELHMAVKLIKPDSCVEGYVPSDYLKPVIASEVAKTDPLVEVDLQTKNAKRSTPAPTPAPVTETKPASTANKEEKPERVIPEAPPPSADPLAATLGLASAIPPAAAPSKLEPLAEKASKSLTVQSQDKGSEEKQLGQVGGTADAPSTAKASPSESATHPKPAPATLPNTKAEIKDGEYVVPTEIEKQLGKAFSIMLARVVKELQKPEFAIMLITTNKEYIGIPYEAVAQAITSPTDLLSNLQKHGWLHPEPGKPRAMVHQLSVTNGGATKAAYVTLSRGFAKKAKLPF